MRATAWSLPVSPASNARPTRGVTPNVEKKPPLARATVTLSGFSMPRSSITWGAVEKPASEEKEDTPSAKAWMSG